MTDVSLNDLDREPKGAHLSAPVRQASPRAHRPALYVRVLLGALVLGLGCSSSGAGSASGDTSTSNGAVETDTASAASDSTDSATDGTDATDGADGTDGAVDTTDADGSDVSDGTNGADTSDATDGGDGVDTTDGTDGGAGIDATDATDATDAMDGGDGTDGNIEYDAQGCITYNSTSELCGAKSDHTVCKLAATCRGDGDASQCSIDCEMSPSIGCLDQPAVQCVLSAVAAGNCAALGSCSGWYLVY